MGGAGAEAEARRRPGTGVPAGGAGPSGGPTGASRGRRAFPGRNAGNVGRKGVAGGFPPDGGRRGTGAKRGPFPAGGGAGLRVASGRGGARAARRRAGGGAPGAKNPAACVGFPPVSQGDRARDSRHAYIRKFRLPGAENWWIRADFGPKDCAIHRVAIPGEKSDVCVTPQAGQAAGPWKETPHEDSDFRHRD